jgi:hypothetical protein
VKQAAGPSAAITLHQIGIALDNCHDSSRCFPSGYATAFDSSSNDTGSAAGDGSPEAVLKAGLHFVQLVGGVEEARYQLVGFEELIETARAVE